MHGILLHDSHVDFLNLLGQKLRRDGFHVETARTHAEAAEILKGFQPDLLLTEVVRREFLGGADLGKQIHADLGTCDPDYPEVALLHWHYQRNGVHRLDLATVDRIRRDIGRPVPTIVYTDRIEHIQDVFGVGSLKLAAAMQVDEVLSKHRPHEVLLDCVRRHLGAFRPSRGGTLIPDGIDKSIRKAA